MTTPNKMLLVIDTQTDFIMETGALPVPGAENIIEPGRACIRGLNPDAYDSMLFTFDTHDEGAYIGSPENLGDEATGAPGFPIHCVKDTVGHSNLLITAIEPSWAIRCFTLEKNVFDMWEQPDIQIQEPGNPEYRPSRDEFFDAATARGVDTVTVIGVAADFCVMWAIRGLLERGFKVEVVEHLTAGIQRDIRQTIAEEFPDQVEII